jgi:hypothetical protein
VSVVRHSLPAAALEPVLATRRARLLAAEQALAAVLARLAAVDAEIAALDADLAQITRQVAAWDAGWQRWTHDGGAPMHGKAYVDQHLYLAAWREELNEQRDEQQRERAAIENQAAAGRAKVLRAQARIEAVRQAQQRALRAQLAPAQARREADAVEMLAARVWLLQRA